MIPAVFRFAILVFFIPALLHCNLPAPVLRSPEKGMKGVDFLPTLSWDSVPGAHAYRLVLSLDKHFSTLNVDTTLSATQLTLPRLGQNLRYYWIVRAISPSGSSEWSEAWFFSTHTFTARPAAPKPLLPANGSRDLPSRLVLSWERPALTEACRIQVSLSDDFTEVLADTLCTNDTLGLSLSQGIHCFWRVSALNTIGEGPWSPAHSFETKEKYPKPPVTELIAPAKNSRIDTGGCMLLWYRVSDAESYRLQIGPDADFGSLLLDTVLLQPEFIFPAPEEGKEYFWRVNALNTEKESGWSEAWNFTRAAPLSVEEAPSGAMSIDNGTLSIRLEEDCFLRIWAYSLTGEKIGTITEGVFPAGERNFPLTITHGNSPLLLYVHAGSATYFRLLPGL